MAKKSTTKKTDTEIIAKGGIQWSIYPDRKSGKWMLYTRVAGERILRCRATKQGAIDAIPGEIIKLKERGFSESITLSGPSAGDYQSAIKALHRFDNVSLLDAANYYAHNHSYLSTRISTQTAVDEYIKEKEEAELSDIYIKSIKNRLGNFANEFGSKDLISITNQDLTKWLSKYKSKTRNNHLSEVSTFLTWAQNKGYLKEGKTASHKIQKSKEKGGKVYIATQAQFNCILDIANNAKTERGRKNAVIFLSFAFLTGIRSSEVERLYWRDVFPNHITIGKESTKTMSRRLVPVFPRLSKILAPLRGNPNDKLIDMLHFQRPLTSAIREKRKTDESIAALLPAKWPKNFGRHSWISYCVALNSDVAKTSLQAGNSPKKIFEDYLSITMSDGNIITEDLAKVWFGYQ